MNRIGRTLAVFGAILGLLLSAAWLQFGYEAVQSLFGPNEYEWVIFAGILIVSIVSAFLRAWSKDWQRRTTAANAAVVLGVIIFIYGILGGGAVCTAMGYGPNADYGVTYDWSNNVIKFGDNIDDSNYRCSITPYRVVAVTGYALVSMSVLYSFPRER